MSPSDSVIESQVKVLLSLGTKKWLSTCCENDPDPHVRAELQSAIDDIPASTLERMKGIIEERLRKRCLGSMGWRIEVSFNIPTLALEAIDALLQKHTVTTS